MNKSIVFRVVMALILIGAVIGLGVWAYSLGVTKGSMMSTEVSAPVAPYGMPVWPIYGFPFFGFLICLVPLFLVLMISFAFRGIFWHGPRRWGHYYPGPGSDEWMKEKEGWRRGARSVFDQWHTEAHAPKPEPPNSQS
jgi:hypothetical protein